MKILILICILYVHYSASQIPGNSKKLTHPFPKKVRPGIIQYNIAGKYLKPVHVKTKKPGKQRLYTVFAKPFPISEEIKARDQIIPDSPYFPVDKPKEPERRSRVKKILPEYSLPMRYKRAADDNDGEKGKVIIPAVTPSSQTPDEAKNVNSPAPKTVDVEDGGKKISGPVKKLDGQVDRIKSSNKRGQDGVKKGVREPLSRTKLHKSKGSRQQKLRNPQNKRMKTLSRPVLGRSKKLKHSQKSISKSKLAERNMKRSQPQRGDQRLRNKNKLAKARLTNTSKLRGARNPKGRISRRLIAARDAMIEEYPYTISIQKDGNHWCSGAILNPRLIITTANCLWRSNSISRMRVRAGSRHTDRGGQVAKIQEVMKHPGWKIRKNPDNDIALALLDRNIRFSHGVHGVDLPNRVMLPPFDDAWVTSWGAERRDGIFDSRSVNLQAYHARLIDRNKCNNMTMRFAVAVTENFICLSQSGTRAPCTRDTGAPAVSDGVLWGLASWGIRKLCGTERFPAIFSYLGSQSNINFIINATHYLMGEERSYPFLDRFPVKKISTTASTAMTLPYKR